MKINAYCEDRGWLFEDLKRYLADAGAITSEQPLQKADAWICLRTREWQKSPNVARTLVQVHGFDRLDSPVKAQLVGAATAYTHELQQWAFEGSTRRKDSRVVPIGARSYCHAYAPPETPTLAFMARETPAMHKGSLGFAELVRRLNEETDTVFRAVAYGPNLQHLAAHGIDVIPRAARPEDFADVTVLYVGTRSPAVPLSMYEALACGVLVVSNRPHLLPRGFDFDSVFWANAREAISDEGLPVDDGLVDVVTLYLSRKERDGCAERREPQMPYTVEAWAAEQVRIAESLARGVR